MSTAKNWCAWRKRLWSLNPWMPRKSKWSCGVKASRPSARLHSRERKRSRRKWTLRSRPCLSSSSPKRNHLRHSAIADFRIAGFGLRADRLSRSKYAIEIRNPQSEIRNRSLRCGGGFFISVDTYKSRVAEAALQAGADLINDISGFHWDPEMAATVAQLDAAAVVMHTRGTPKTMQTLSASVDIFAEVESHLRASLLKASRAALSHDKIIIDPGIGFGKSLADNLRILRNLDYFQGLDCPVLVGPSRK